MWMRIECSIVGRYEKRKRISSFDFFSWLLVPLVGCIGCVECRVIDDRSSMSSSGYHITTYRYIPAAAVIIL